MNRLPAIGLIACRVFEQELALHTGKANIVETRFLEVALHDRPNNLRQLLQCEIDSFNANSALDAVVLLYGLCGLGTAGLQAGRHRVVIPRAHDCMTLYMGSKEKFAQQQADSPDCFYYTPGWMQAGRTPSPARLKSLEAELLEKFEPEDVAFLLETEKANWAQHNKAVFLDLGTPSADALCAEAKEAAHSLNWKFERIPGDPSLFCDLLLGRWDCERFQILEPGQQLAHSPDEKIFCSRVPST